MQQGLEFDQGFSKWYSNINFPSKYTFFFMDIPQGEAKVIKKTFQHFEGS